MAGSPLAEAFILIRGDATPLNKTLGAVSRNLYALGSLEQRIGMALGSAFGVAVGGASNLQETVNKLNVVFGDSAKVATDAAETMARKFGVVRQEFLDVEGTYGQLLQGMGGMTERASAEMAAKLAKAAADASSLWNTSFQDAAEKVASALRGQARPIAAFGVDTQMAAVKQEALRMGLGRTSAGLTMQAKVAARTSLVLKGLKVTEGDLENTQDTFANAFRQAWGRVTNTLTTIGQAFLPTVERFLGGLNKMLAGVESWAESSKGAFAKWMGGVEPVGKTAGWAFGQVWDAAKSTGQRLAAEMATWTTLNATLGAGWQWLKSAAMGIFEGIGIVFRNWSLIGEYAGTMVMEKLINVGEAFTWLMGAAGQFGSWFAGNWVNLIRDAAVGAWTVLSNLATNIKNLFTAVWDFLKNPGGGFNFQFTPFLEGFKAATEKLPEIAKPAFSNLSKELGDITDKMALNEADRLRNNAAQTQVGAAPPAGAPARRKPLMPGEEDDKASKKGKKDAEITDVAGHFKNLQLGFLGKDDSAKATAKNTDRSAKACEEMTRLFKENLRSLGGPGYAV